MSKRDRKKNKKPNHFTKVFETFEKKWSKRNRKNQKRGSENRKKTKSTEKNEHADTLILKVNFSEGEKLDYGPTWANY